MSISEQIASDTRVQIRVDLGGGRLVAKLGIDVLAVEKDENGNGLLGNIRSKAPDTARLLESVKDTGVIFDQILVYAEFNAEQGKIIYYVADGHQRLIVAKKNGDKFVYVQIVTTWTSREMAYKAAISKQYARFEMTDKDLFGIMKQKKLTVAELVKITGKSEATLTRMNKICEHVTLVDAVVEGAIAMHVAAKLIDECKENPRRLTAFLNSFEDEYTEAKKQALHYENRYKVEGRPKKRDLQDLAKVSHYFKGFNSEKWMGAINDVKADAPFDPNQRLEIDNQKAVAKAEIEIGDATSLWDDQIPIYFRGGQKHKDMTLKNLKQFRDSLQMIRNNMEVIIERREKLEVQAAVPMPSANPITEFQAPEKPEEQSTDMDVTQ
jgi:ParB-like chromosome segregation protein Spo0J